ncbi:hypothetical protein D9M71_595890 [compost metagenome]
MAYVHRAARGPHRRTCSAESPGWCRRRFREGSCACPGRFCCVPYPWLAVHSVWLGHACVPPGRPPVARPATPAAARRRRGRRHWSGVRWPCRAGWPVCADENRVGRAGGRFLAGLRRPGQATALRLLRIAAAPFPGRLPGRSARSRCHRQPPSDTPVGGAPSAGVPAAAGRACARSVRAGAVRSDSCRTCASCSPGRRHGGRSTGT